MRSGVSQFQTKLEGKLSAVIREMRSVRLSGNYADGFTRRTFADVAAAVLYRFGSAVWFLPEWRLIEC